MSEHADPEVSKCHVNIDAEGRAIARAIKKMLDKAKAAGIRQPSVFFESEGSVYIIDQDHPGYTDHTERTAIRQAAVCGQAFIAVSFDVGAW